MSSFKQVDSPRLLKMLGSVVFTSKFFSNYVKACLKNSMYYLVHFHLNYSEIMISSIMIDFRDEYDNDGVC